MKQLPYSLSERLLLLCLKTIAIVLKHANTSFRTTTKPVVLCYHSIASDAWRFSTSPSEFRKQMQYLRRRKLVVPLREAIINPKKKKNLVSVTFDDGYVDNLFVAAKILKKLHIPATLFVLGDRERADRMQLGNNKKLLTIQQIQALSKQGWEIGYHTKTHASLLNQSDSKLQEEIIDGKKQLEKQLGFRLHYFAYPQGVYSSQIISFVRKAGFKAAFTINGGSIHPVSQGMYGVSRVPMASFITGRLFGALLSPIGLQVIYWYMILIRLKEHKAKLIQARLISQIFSPLYSRVLKLNLKHKNKHLEIL